MQCILIHLYIIHIYITSGSACIHKVMAVALWLTVLCTCRLSTNQQLAGLRGYHPLTPQANCYNPRQILVVVFSKTADCVYPSSSSSITGRNNNYSSSSSSLPVVAVGTAPGKLLRNQWPRRFTVCLSVCVYGCLSVCPQSCGSPNRGCAPL